MADGQGVGEGLTVGRGGVVGRFLNVEFGFKDGDVFGGEVGDGGESAFGVGVGERSGVGQDRAVLVAEFIIHAGGDEDDEGVVVRHVVGGGGGVAESENQIVAASARRGDSRRGQCAVEISGKQSAAGCRAGDDVVTDVDQPDGQVINDRQGLRHAFGQGDQNGISDCRADGCAGWSRSALVNLRRGQRGVDAGCCGVVVKRAAHAVRASALASRYAGQAGVGQVGGVGNGNASRRGTNNRRADDERGGLTGIKTSDRRRGGLRGKRFRVGEGSRSHAAGTNTSRALRGGGCAIIDNGNGSEIRVQNIAQRQIKSGGAIDSIGCVVNGQFINNRIARVAGRGGNGFGQR